ncbi:hypothetical protein B4144_2773 [Bacillus atrophaeus]|nr:hypothetical protein B4144_2773 [Bacillus atrophaeus]
MAACFHSLFTFFNQKPVISDYQIKLFFGFHAKMPFPISEEK